MCQRFNLVYNLIRPICWFVLGHGQDGMGIDQPGGEEMAVLGRGPGPLQTTSKSESGLSGFLALASQEGVKTRRIRTRERLRRPLKFYPEAA